MKGLMRSGLVALLLVPAAAVAQGGVGLPLACADMVPSTLTGPFAVVAVNTTCLDLTGLIRATTPGKVWRLDANVTVASATVHVFGTFNADPFVTFGATTTNPPPGPMTYTFAFGTPVVPDLYDAATSTGGVSLTNGVSGTSSVSPVGSGGTYIKGFGVNPPTVTNLGVDLGTETCTASGVPLTVTQVCGQGTASNTFAPTFYSGLLASLSYEQTDAASTASWSGAVTLTAAQQPPSTVPEPSTLLLVAGGLALAGAAAARRRPS